MTWREQKAAARDIVHQTMKVALLVLATIPYDSNSGEHLPQVHARIHNREMPLGDQAGTSLNSAERYEPVPKAIFWKQELIDAGVTLARNQILSVSSGEAYSIDVVHPHDIETITVNIIRLDAADAAGLPLPV